MSGLLAAFESFVICSRHLAADSSFFNLRDTCFFQLFFWRAFSSSCALLVLVCMFVFFIVEAAFEPFVFVGATPIFSSY